MDVSKVGLKPVKTYPTIGCCGLDCGLCPRYYTLGSSRCPGCCGPNFLNKHPSCSYITCCVKKKKLEVCAQCDEFPCQKFEAWLVSGGESDSFLTHKKAHPNLIFIGKHGLEEFIKRQSRRIGLLKIMINSFDDGRYKNFYCIAATLLPVADLETALYEGEQKVEADKIKSDDLKAKSKILKALLKDSAAREGIELKLRKK